MIRLILLLISFIPAIATSQSTATKIQPGIEYEGPAELEAPSVGVGFTLPSGWSGGLPRDAELFIMAPGGQEGYIFAGADEMSIDDAANAMASPVPLGDGISLNPKGTVDISGNSLVGDYDVRGAPQPLISTARTIVGDHGTGIYFIGVFPSAHETMFRSALYSLAETVRFFVAVEDATPEGNVSSAALAGRKITRFYTSSGYSETESMHLCGNGAFYRNAESGGFGGGASGAFQSSNAGQWAVQGQNLVLSYPDGSTATYELALDGTKLTLDGTRWFREATDCR